MRAWTETPDNGGATAAAGVVASEAAWAVDGDANGAAAVGAALVADGEAAGPVVDGEAAGAVFGVKPESRASRSQRNLLVLITKKLKSKE
jgi:hypothetical protein